MRQPRCTVVALPVVRQVIEEANVSAFDASQEVRGVWPVNRRILFLTLSCLALCVILGCQIVSSTMSTPVVVFPTKIPVVTVTIKNPPPTWTPTALPTVTPTPPDVTDEINTYLDELDPLLDDASELWEEWAGLWEGKPITYCTQMRATVRIDYRGLEARQSEVNSAVADLRPPSVLGPAHRHLLSSLRQYRESQHSEFNACVTGNRNYATVANEQASRAHDEWIRAMDELRKVLARHEIERESEPLDFPEPPEVEA
jgi:hypothetical protein